MFSYEYMLLQQLHFQTHIALEKAVNLKHELELLLRLLGKSKYKDKIITDEIDRALENVTQLITELKSLFDTISKDITELIEEMR